MALQMPTGDLRAAQQNPKYDQQGMLIPGTGGLPAGGWAALPQLTQQQPQPQQQAASAPVDPVTKFNQNILDMLKQAQGFSTAHLSNEANRLGVQQITDSMAPASQLGIDNLRPGDALNARENVGQLYNPEIKNLNDRIVASRQAIDSFKDALAEARKYSEDYVGAIKPDEQTIKALQDMLIAGENPPKAVLDAAYKYIDWAAVAAGKKTSGSEKGPSSYEEYIRTTDNPTPEGYAKFLKGSGPKAPAPLQSEREGQFIADTRAAFNASKGSDGFINPDGYRDAMYEAERRGYLSPDQFKDKFPVESYISPENQVGDLAFDI